MSAVQKICPDTRRFMLVPENHTRNPHYLSNVATLKRILEGAGLTVRIGSLIPELKEPMEVEASNGERLRLEPIRRKGNRVYACGDTNFDGLRLPPLVSCWRLRPGGTLGNRAVDIIYAPEPADSVRTYPTRSDHKAVLATYLR